MWVLVLFLLVFNQKNVIGKVSIDVEGGEDLEFSRMLLSEGQCPADPECPEICPEEPDPSCEAPQIAPVPPPTTSPPTEPPHVPPSSPSPSPSPPPPNHRLKAAFKVIQDFKRTITSDIKGITKTWVGEDVCKYKGFFCETPPKDRFKSIASVDFNGFLLSAPTLRKFLDELPQLAIFHANSNGFKGKVPDLSKFKYFYELDISNNVFEGPFPTEILSMKKLLFLDLRFNSFSGSVPSELFIMGLEVLFINNNDFDQNIPETLGKSPVQYLTLANNRFTGPIPSSIGNMSNTLIEVLFLNNSLSGCLPKEIGLLHNATVFDAGSNHLTGPIPLSFGCLKKMQQFNLANNELYGPIPEILCSLKNLVNLSLSNNYFTEVGPICRDLVERGLLDDQNNCILDRPNQRSKEECSLFFSKPRYCTEHGSDFYEIPCVSFHDEPEQNAPPSPSANGNWRTYKTLHRRLA